MVVRIIIAIPNHASLGSGFELTKTVIKTAKKLKEDNNR
jgi:hypothetical protein